MGMYTELHFNAELKQTTPQEVLQVLRHMLNAPGAPARDALTLPAHPLFSTDRWGFMLTCDSYYFAAQTHSTLTYDEITKTHYLCIRCNLKNYDQEIEKFIDWVSPYVDGFPGDFLGFHRYETTEQPTLIFLGGKPREEDG